MNDIVFDIMNGDLESVKSKISAQGELLDSRDEFGRTLLMEAAINAGEDIAGFLIEQGIDVNIQDKNGWTALHFSVQASDSQLVRLLLQNNATIDVQDNFGNTPLGRAVFESRGYGDIITVLLNAGADRNLKNKSGISPLMLAQNTTNFNIIQFF